jgi:translation initiation factor 1
MSSSRTRTVWSDERGGQIGGSPSKQHRKKKQKAPKGITRAGFPDDGIVRVCREKSGRGGKTVTVIVGVPGGNPAKEAMLKELKKQCGCGGKLQSGVVEIQGDQRDRIMTYLDDKGIKAKAAGG